MSKQENGHQNGTEDGRPSMETICEKLSKCMDKIEQLEANIRSMKMEMLKVVNTNYELGKRIDQKGIGGQNGVKSVNGNWEQFGSNGNQTLLLAKMEHLYSQHNGGWCPIMPPTNGGHRWCGPSDSSMLSIDGMTLTCNTSYNWISAITEHPFDAGLDPHKSNQIFYMEATIQHVLINGLASIALTREGFLSDRSFNFPDWTLCSNSSHKIAEVIGIGVIFPANPNSGQFGSFVTRNGELEDGVQNCSITADEKYFPTVSVWKQSTKVEINFGGKPFHFDMSKLPKWNH